MYVYPEPVYPRRMSERFFNSLYFLGTVCLVVSFIVLCVDFATRVRSTFADGFHGDLTFSEGMRLLTAVPTCESQVRMSVGGVALDTALNLSSAQFASVILSVGTLGVVIAHGLLLGADMMCKHLYNSNVRRLRFRGLVVPVHSWCVLSVAVSSTTVLALTYLMADPLRVMKQYTDTCASEYVSTHLAEYLVNETDFKTIFGINFSIVHVAVIVNLAIYGLAVCGRVMHCMETGVKEFYRRKYYFEESFLLFSVPDKAKTYDYSTWTAEVQAKLQDVREPLAEGATEDAAAAQLRAELDTIVLAPHHLLLQLRDKIRRATLRRSRALAEQARRVGGGVGGFDLRRSPSPGQGLYDTDGNASDAFDHSLVGGYPFGDPPSTTNAGLRSRSRNRMAGALDTMRSNFAVDAARSARVFPPQAAGGDTNGDEANLDGDGGDSAEELLLPEAHAYADMNRRRFDPSFGSINPSGYFGGGRLPTSMSHEEISVDSHSSDDEPTRARRLQARQAKREARRRARGRGLTSDASAPGAPNAAAAPGYSPRSAGDAAATTRHHMRNPLSDRATSAAPGGAHDSFALDIAPTPNARERRPAPANSQPTQQQQPRRHQRETSGLSSLGGGQPRRPFHLPPPALEDNGAQPLISSGLQTPTADAAGIAKNPYLSSGDTPRDEMAEDEEYEEYEEYEEVEEEIEEEEEEGDEQPAIGPVHTGATGQLPTPKGAVPISGRFQTPTLVGLPPAGPSASARLVPQQQQQHQRSGAAGPRGARPSRHTTASPGHDSLYSSTGGRSADPQQQQQWHQDPMSSSFSGGSPMARTPPSQPHGAAEFGRRAPGHGVRRGALPAPALTPSAREDGGEADRRLSPAPLRNSSPAPRHQSANRRSGSGTLPPPPPPPSA